MKCIDCSKWSPKDAREMAKFGYGLCAHQPKWHFISSESTCERIVLAPASTVAARVRYLESRLQPKTSNESSAKPVAQHTNVSRETTGALIPLEPLKSGIGQPALS